MCWCISSHYYNISHKTNEKTVEHKYPIHIQTVSPHPYSLEHYTQPIARLMIHTYNMTSGVTAQQHLTSRHLTSRLCSEFELLTVAAKGKHIFSLQSINCKN